MPRPQPDSGFSLLEALVAMAVLAVAAAGLVGATQTHIDRIGDLERRAVALWVAEEALAELRLSGGGGTEVLARREMAGRSWIVSVTRTETSDPDLSRVDLEVREADHAEASARLSGFTDVGAP